MGRRLCQIFTHKTAPHTKLTLEPESNHLKSLCNVCAHCVGGQRARRTVKMVGVATEHQYTEGAIPHEWERMFAKAYW